MEQEKKDEVKVNSWWKSSTEFFSRYQFACGILLGSLATVVGSFAIVVNYTTLSSRNTNADRQNYVL